MRVLIAVFAAIAAVAAQPAPVREDINFDFAWRFRLGQLDPGNSSECDPYFQPVLSFRCNGLSATGAADEAACLQDCCSDANCQVYQFKNNLSDPGAGCWMGQCNDPGIADPAWNGGQRIGAPAPPPPYTSGPASLNYDDSAWLVVDAPHDFIIDGTLDPNDPASGRSYLPRNFSWYRKHFTLPTDFQDQRLEVYFEGVFRTAYIWLNGVYLYTHIAGYTSFSVRIDNVSSLAVDGVTSNVLAIYVDATSGSGWWYEGGGLYRHIHLLKSNHVSVPVFGVFAHGLPSSSVAQNSAAARDGLAASSATVTIETLVANTGTTNQAAACVSQQIVNQEGGVVVTSGYQVYTLPAGATVANYTTLIIQNAQLWTIPRPYLYTVVTTIKDCTSITVYDIFNTTFGVRSIRFDANEGFFMNEQSVKIRGFCNHNDFASVGMAVPDRVNLFRAQAMRSVGGNGWRMSHNPPIPALLDILDRVGITVLDENRLFGNESDYIYNMGELVKRDRNHPSVVIWSFCNEAGCEGSQENGGPAFQAITYLYDGTRPTLANMFTYNDLLSNTIDVQGFSHRDASDMNVAHAAMPKKPIVSSECCSCNTQRGEDVGAPGIESNFNADCVAQQTNWSNGEAYNAGSFVWTLGDYYGEPSFGGWPHVSSTFGSFDLAGFAKAAVFWYRSYWLLQIPDTAADKPFTTAGEHVVHIVEHARSPAPPAPPMPSSGQLFAAPCDETVNQQVVYTTQGRLRFADGTCAVAACTNESCPVTQLAPCVDGATNQQFKYVNGSFSPSSASGACLDFWSGGVGPNVGLYYCNQQLNQKWQLSASDQTIINVMSGACMSNVATGQNGLLRTVNVYSDAPVVTLWLDGVQVGAAQNLSNPIASAGRTYAQFTAVKWPFNGTLSARAQDHAGNVLATHTRAPVGAATAMTLAIDSPSPVTGTGAALFLDGQDAALVRVTFVDQNGNFVNDATNNVSFEIISGPGRVVGTHNGDPTNHINNHSPSNVAYHGLARCVVMVTMDAATPAMHRRRLLQLAVERSQPTVIVNPDAPFTAPTEIVLQASSPGLTSVQISIPLSVDPADAVLPVAARSTGPVVFN